MAKNLNSKCARFKTAPPSSHWHAKSIFERTFAWPMTIITHGEYRTPDQSAQLACLTFTRHTKKFDKKKVKKFLGVTNAA